MEPLIILIAILIGYKILAAPHERVLDDAVQNHGYEPGPVYGCISLLFAVVVVLSLAIAVGGLLAGGDHALTELVKGATK